MIASSPTGVFNVQVPGADFGERLFASLRSWASTTVATVADGGERLAQLFRTLVVPAVEPLPLQAMNALAWVNGRMLDGFDYVGTSAAASMSFVDDEIRDIRDRTLDAVDQTVHAGLQRLGIPTQQEFTALSRRMDRIAATVERLKHEVEPKATAPRATRRTTK